MRLFFYEWRKLIQRKVTWILIAILFCANGLLVVREISNTENGYSLQDVRQVYNDMMCMPLSEQKEWIEERMACLTQQMGSQQYDMSGYPYQTYTDTCVQESLLISHVYDQVEKLQDYDSYLKYVEEQADQMTQLTIFAQPNTYSYRNMIRIRERYQRLKGVQIKTDFSDGVKMVTDWRWTDIFLLCSIVLLLLDLFVKEREEGLLLLVKPTKNGYSATIWSKAAVMISIGGMFTFLFYGANFILVFVTVGFGDLSRSLQSLDGYISCAMRITAGEYLLCFLGAKIIAVLAVCSVIGLLCVRTRSSFYTILFSVGISAAEIFCWKQIDSHSWIWPMAQFNLAAILDTGSYFAEYENINFFGWPIDRMLVGGVMSAGVIAFCCIRTVRRFCVEQTLIAGKKRRFLTCPMQMNFFHRIHTCLWRHECFKLYITSRGLLLLIIFCILQFGSYFHRSYYTTAEEYEYKKYSESLEGVLYWRKEIFLQKEKEKFDETEQEIEELYTRYEAGEISETSLHMYEDRLQISDAKRNAYDNALTQYTKLLEFEGNGEYVEYIEQTGWNALLGSKGRREAAWNAGKMLFILSMAIIPYFVMEYSTGADEFHRISFVGKKALTLRKIVLCSIYAILTSEIAFLPQIVSVWNHYGMSLPAVSVHSILCLSAIPAGIPLRLWFFLLVIGEMAGAVAFSLILALCFTLYDNVRSEVFRTK